VAQTKRHKPHVTDRGTDLPGDSVGSHRDAQGSVGGASGSAVCRVGLLRRGERQRDAQKEEPSDAMVIIDENKVKLQECAKRRVSLRKDVVTMCCHCDEGGSVQ
jgi:hypothetical protein